MDAPLPDRPLAKTLRPRERDTNRRQIGVNAGCECSPSAASTRPARLWTRAAVRPRICKSSGALWLQSLEVGGLATSRGIKNFRINGTSRRISSGPGRPIQCIRTQSMFRVMKDRSTTSERDLNEVVSQTNLELVHNSRRKRVSGRCSAQTACETNCPGAPRIACP
jgi:hypothetical protein